MFTAGLENLLYRMRCCLSSCASPHGKHGHEAAVSQSQNIRHLPPSSPIVLLHLQTPISYHTFIFSPYHPHPSHSLVFFPLRPQSCHPPSPPYPSRGSLALDDQHVASLVSRGFPSWQKSWQKSISRPIMGPESQCRTLQCRYREPHAAGSGNV